MIIQQLFFALLIILFPGCHLCNFFLGTYDLSVPFPACTTSCRF